MHSPTCVSVVVCVARKPRHCLSYSWREYRINLVFLRSYYKGGGGTKGDNSCLFAAQGSTRVPYMEKAGGVFFFAEKVFLLVHNFGEASRSFSWYKWVFFCTEQGFHWYKTGFFGTKWLFFAFKGGGVSWPVPEEDVKKFVKNVGLHKVPFQGSIKALHTSCPT